MKQYHLVASNGAQTFILNERDKPGLHQFVYIADTYPGAGTATFEYRLVGDDEAWRQVPNGLTRSLTGSFELYLYGWVESLRVTIADLSGGASLSFLAGPISAYGPLPSHFTDPSGRESRLQVDVAQTSFFTGHEFRTFYEFSIAAAASFVIKAVVPVNTILHSLSLSVDAGGIRLSTALGGTEGGTFGTTLPVIPKNRMTEVPAPVYVPQTTITGGGTITGHTVIDVVRLVAATGQSSTVAIVGGGEDDERGVAPGTYYWILENISNQTATGTFHANAEERPGLPVG